jgi:hypothetical protein
VKILGVVKSTTFLFITQCTLAAKNRVIISQTVPVQHFQAGCDVALAPALRPRVRVPPWRPGRRAALLGRLHCPRPRPPKQRAVPRQTHAPRTAGVSAAACRARVRARRPCPRCPHRVRRAACGQAPVFPMRSSLRRQEGARPAIKVVRYRAQDTEEPSTNDVTQCNGE